MVVDRIQADDRRLQIVIPVVQTQYFDRRVRVVHVANSDAALAGTDSVGIVDDAVRRIGKIQDQIAGLTCEHDVFVALEGVANAQWRLQVQDTSDGDPELESRP